MISEPWLKVFALVLFLSVTVVLIILGWLLRKGKIFSLLTGETPDTIRQDKEKNKLSRFFGWMFWALALCSLLWPLGLFVHQAFLWVGVILFPLILVAAVVLWRRNSNS